jgi:aryl-alcohol dehydrogenase-like predicted oxidoreductase
MSNRFILGTVQFGLNYGINNPNGKPSEENVFKILDEAYEKGICQLDTADAYGDAQRLIGKFSASTGKQFLINTKFKVDEAVSIRRQLENSLEQLNAKQINVYFYHRFEEMVKYPKTISELEYLKEKRNVSKTGVSVYTNKEFETCIHADHVDVIQLPFNLLDNFLKRGSLLKKAKEKGKEIQVRSVFLQGLFFKDLHSFPGYLEPLKPYVSQVKEIASAKKISVLDLALAYALKKKEIDHIIIGVDSIEHLQANLAAAAIAFDEELEREIDNINVAEEELLFPYNWK